MSPDHFRRLAAAGLTTEQIALVMEVMGESSSIAEMKLEEHRAKGRERYKRWSENKTTNVSKRSKTLANVAKRPARVEDKTSTTDIEPQKREEKETRARRDIAEFRAEMTGAGLDSDRLEALVSHRRSKRAAMTGHAAKLLIRDIEACRLTLPDGVDTVISRNWIAIKPDWLISKNQRDGPSSQSNSRPPQLADIFKTIGDASANERTQRENFEGFGGNISYLPAIGSR